MSSALSLFQFTCLPVNPFPLPLDGTPGAPFLEALIRIECLISCMLHIKVLLCVRFQKHNMKRNKHWFYMESFIHRLSQRALWAMDLTLAVQEGDVNTRGSRWALSAKSHRGLLEMSKSTYLPQYSFPKQSVCTRSLLSITELHTSSKGSENALFQGLIRLPTQKLPTGNWFHQTILSWYQVKHLPGMRETWVPSLSLEDPLEKQMATHSSILAWRIPRRDEPGGLRSMGSERVGHDWATSLSSLYYIYWLLVVRI